LFLKGLGYKVIIENNMLLFKLNLSHELKIEIPSYINRVLVNKTNIVFESYDIILLGNFIEKIYNFKPKDSYKGKGFSLQSKVVPIKEIKKK
jgi:ribosomal protein L6P/L9E